MERPSQSDYPLVDHTEKQKKTYFGVYMRQIHFTKAEGAQNDFVIVDDRERDLSDDERRLFTQRISHRRKGAGSDGAIFIDASDTHDFIMAFYNPDGSVGSMCGNGGRCAALYAARKGIADADMRFEVLGRSYTAAVQGSEVTLSFPPPDTIGEVEHVATSKGIVPLRFVDTGAPHAVIVSDDLPEGLNADFHLLDMRVIGPLLRHHERFAPRGVNVNVIRLRGGIIDIRTFEKGVEDETEACGTGTIAAAIAAHLRFALPPPLTIATHGGDTLYVGYQPDDAYTTLEPGYYMQELFLRGPAKLVFEGDYELGEDPG